jgi:integrase
LGFARGDEEVDEMPRPAKGPRLYLSTEHTIVAGKRVAETTWRIRDGAYFGRTGCGEGDRAGAEKKLGAYIAAKYQPAVREGDLTQVSVPEVLTAYGREHAPYTRGSSPSNAGYNIAALLPYWGDKMLSDVRGATCRAYTAYRAKKVKPATIRRELVTLSAAIVHWHKEHGPLTSVPAVTMPDVATSKADWLTRTDAALLLAGALGFYRCRWTDIASRKMHVAWRRDREAINRPLARFILIGLATGTRHAAILGVRWLPSVDTGWVDLDAGVMHRRGQEEGETTKRRPPVRLGRKIMAHLRRWKAIDELDRAEAARIYEARDHRWREYLPPAPFLHVVAYEGRAVQKMRKPWYAAIDLSGLRESATPHILRHTRATWMMQAGVPLWKAAGYLGMTAKMLDDRYGHHHPDFQKEAAEV